MSSKKSIYWDILNQDISNEEKLKLIESVYVSPQSSNKYVKSRQMLIKDAIIAYFESTVLKKPYDYNFLASDILFYINKVIQLDNATGKHDKYRLLTELSYSELQQIIPNLYTFKNVRRDVHASSDMCVLMYCSEEGYYKDADSFVEMLCRSLNTAILKKDIAEVISGVSYRAGAPVDEERNPSWVFCKNGIFDKEYWEKNQELIPYSEDIIAVNPLPINFNPGATNSSFQFENESFDVENFLDEISNNQADIKKLLWDVLSAEIHHNRNYKKAVCLYSSVGNNGKGTFLTLSRSLIGSDLCVDIPIESFSDKNLVVNLMNSRLVTGDENMVDSYIDNSTNFKCAVTGDPITVDRKYRNSVTFSFSGLILQCMNGLPATKDKTNSFYRRILIVPFNNCFTGKENTRIKDIYLKDNNVLEYVLYKALMLDVQELKDVDATLTVLNEYREDNDTLIQWWNDEGSQVDYVWNFIPWTLFYGSYVWWMKHNSIRGDVNMNSRKFIKEFKLKVLPILGSDWELCPDSGFYVGKAFDKPEPLIGKYNVDELRNPNYKGSEWVKIGSNGGQYKSTYKGLLRTGGASNEA